MQFYLFLNQNLELSGNLMPRAYNTSPVHTFFFFGMFKILCVCFHIKNYQSEKMTRQELVGKSRVRCGCLAAGTGFNKHCARAVGYKPLAPLPLFLKERSVSFSRSPD